MTILLACPPEEAAALQVALSPYQLAADFHIGEVTGLPEMLQSGQYTQLVATAQLWPGPEELQANLGAGVVPTVICVPPTVTAEATQALHQLPALRGLLQWDGETLKGEIRPLPVPTPAGGDAYAAAQAPPLPAEPAPAPPPWAPESPLLTPPADPPLPVSPPATSAAAPPAGGWRCVAVWSLEGGAGKTTLALATAHAAADRNIPTLVISLAGPDMVPMYTGLHPRPGLMEWLAQGADGTAMSSVMRNDGRVSHVTGPPSTAELTAWHLETMHTPDRDLRSLVLQCAQAANSLIILDLGPSGDIATQALDVAMDLIVPVSCTFRGSMLLACALEQVAQQEFRSITAVLNRLRKGGGMSEQTFRRQIERSQLQRQPDSWVLIEDDLPGIQAIHDSGGQPHRSSSTLRAAAGALQELIFPVATATEPPPRRSLFRRRR